MFRLSFLVALVFSIAACNDPRGRCGAIKIGDSVSSLGQLLDCGDGLHCRPARLEDDEAGAFSQNSCCFPQKQPTCEADCNGLTRSLVGEMSVGPSTSPNEDIYTACVVFLRDFKVVAKGVVISGF